MRGGEWLCEDGRTNGHRHIGVILRAPALQKERKQQMSGTLLASLMRATILRVEG